MPHPTKSPTTKTSRALPRRWARLLFVKASETFTHGGRRYYKSVIPCVAIDSKGSRVFFAPWTRVRTSVLVRDARPGGKSSQPNPGKTHYVGDDCPGGHAEWETAGGTTPEQNESRVFPTQPNSDNKVNGPTS